MFSSNQKLEISGSLDGKDLVRCLKFALKQEGAMKSFKRKEDPAVCVWQITKDGRYCIGWSPANSIKEGWNAFQFDFDIDIISTIIKQHLLKIVTVDVVFPNGSTDKGFIMKVIPESLAEETDGIRNPFYGIVQFELFTCFYSK